MARARNIKPGFFSNDDLADISPLGRLLFIGLWTVADREGRLEDRHRRIKAEILPYDDCNVNELLDDLQLHGFILRYEIDGSKCIQILNFKKHQDPHYKERASELPAPEGHEDSGKTPGGVSEAVRQAVFDRDGRACKECGSTDDISIDHIIPRSKGGTHDEDNLQTLCRRCNSAKNNRQAKADLNQSSANDGSTIVQPSPGQSPLIPDSGFPITDSIEKEKVKKENPDASPPAQPAPKKSTGAKVTGTRLPENFQVPDDWIDWATDERPDIPPADMRTVAESFVDYWAAKAGAAARKVDWQATWRNWIRNQKRYATPPPAKQQKFDPTAYVNRNRVPSHDIIDV